VTSESVRVRHTLRAVPNADLTQQVIETSLRLINASRSGDIDGQDVASELGHDGSDVELYYCFREAVRRGELTVAHWRGGMGLPSIVRLPAMG
jgi:hypothetical protein